MPSRLFQNIISQLKDVIHAAIGILDASGNIVACSEEHIHLKVNEELIEEFENKDVVVKDGFTFRAFKVRNKVEYIVFIQGEDEVALTYSGIMMISISNLKQLYDEKYDKTNFIKNVIFDNILPGDIGLKAKDLHLALEVNRVVFLIRIHKHTGLNLLHVYDTVKSLFPERNKDFVINIDDDNIALVKELKGNTDSESLEKLAKTIVDTISTEVMTKVTIGIGTIAPNIRELARSYKEAQVALEVGKVFDTEKSIISYNNLGIGRLIYQLPTTLCELFLSEVFKKDSIDALDDETIFTIQKFFENNLNVSETARQLYVHRNTLVYRLDKIQKITGLDLRTFDDAIIFKVAMMVKKYLVSNPIKM